MSRDEIVTALENCAEADEKGCPEDCPMRDEAWKAEGGGACRELAEEDTMVPVALIRRTIALLKAQEPKHGQWITDGDHMICSVCENVPFNQVKLNDKMIYNMDIGNMMKYCPICGARMDGDEDGETDAE